MRDATWSTDRRSCAERWHALGPDVPVETLVAWLDDPPTDADEVRRVLRGPVARIVEAFEAEIGLWDS